ncbi:MAG TPA: class I adenylate-forming enzyme family protein [Streptosporangiaceae bacterium]|nr:class I adenylate-forming enzyme family protein [Streptosporangiaceae bacterium]
MTVVEAPTDHSSIDDHLAYHAVTRPEAVAVWCAEFEWTYGELEHQVARYARVMVGQGIGRGDVVAVFGNSRPECLVVFLACCQTGALYLGLNPKYTLRELQFVCSDAKPGLMFVFRDSFMGEEVIATVDQLIGQLPAGTAVVTDGIAGLGSLQQDLDTVRARVPTAGIGDGERPREQPCAIVYTSGSTGTPKGALLAEHGAVRSARLSWRYWYGAIEHVRAVVQHPINHVGWLVCECVAGLVAGGSLYFRERFDGGATLRLIEEHQLNLWVAFPTMLRLAMQSPEWQDCNLTSLRRVALGTAPEVEILRQFRQRSDAIFCVSYGLTEAHGGAVTVTDDAAPLAEVAGSIGRPLPGIEVRIADEAGGDVRSGDAGELLVRDSTVFLGYLNRPDATAETIGTGGWLRTGDIAVADPAGTMRLVGRMKEMYKSGGYNVYPPEIERIIASYGDVVQVAVVGAPDPLWESVGIAFLVVGSQDRFAQAPFAAYLRSQLANYKVPKRFEFLSAMPQLPNGKVDRVELRRRAAQLVVSDDS